MTSTLRLLKSVLLLHYPRYKNERMPEKACLIYFLFPHNKIIMLLFSLISAIKEVSLFTPKLGSSVTAGHFVLVFVYFISQGEQ
jgi:hypothetical protein